MGVGHDGTSQHTPHTYTGSNAGNKWSKLIISLIWERADLIIIDSPFLLHKEPARTRVLLYTITSGVLMRGLNIYDFSYCCALLECNDRACPRTSMQ